MTKPKHTTIVPLTAPTPDAPRTSWWLDADRENFTFRAEQQRAPAAAAPARQETDAEDDGAAEDADADG
jgi:hypothetical protein